MVAGPHGISIKGVTFFTEEEEEEVIEYRWIFLNEISGKTKWPNQRTTDQTW